VSATALAESLSASVSPTPSLDPVGIESDSCAVCGHHEESHELLLTSTICWVICHESTEDGECFRVRHAQGVAFGACRRDPA
jgi:hypothetical protein